MSNVSSLSDRLSRALTTPAQGVLGLVDELLAASHEQEIQLSWQAGRCQVVIPHVEPPERIEVPVPKSVVRAVLARVATLCNDRIPNSITPYQGLGEVALDAANVIRVRFVNTPDEQTLELSPTRLQQVRQSGEPTETAW